MPIRRQNAKADVAPQTSTTSPTNTTTAGTTTTSPTNTTTTRPETPVVARSPAREPARFIGKTRASRPRGVGFGLGASGALLRAAGALPRTGRREKTAKESDPTRVNAEQRSSSEAVQVAAVESRLETSEVLPKEESAEPPVVAKAASKTDPLETSPADLNSPPAENFSSDATDFLEYCLGGSAALLEMEMDFVECENKADETFHSIEPASEDEAEETAKLDSHACQEFSMMLNPTSGTISESEGDEDGHDLEDMFDFDPARLAELMSSGASIDELTDHLQESYACAFERRLSIDNKKEAAVEADSAADDARPSLQMGELTPLMTPEQVTPLMTPSLSPKGAASSTSTKKDAEQALEEEAKRRSERARRSVAMQHRPSATQRGDAAVKAMESFGRRSLARLSGAGSEEREQLQDAVVDAMRRASRRHRRSVAKAAEVLEEVAEASKVPLDNWSEDKIDDKVEVVQKAMEEAYKQHRRSITAAVRDVVTGTVEKSMKDITKDVSKTWVQNRIREAVIAAHTRHKARTEQSQWAEQWHREEQWHEEQQSHWPEPHQEKQQIPWAEQWHGQEQTQWVEPSQEEHQSQWSESWQKEEQQTPWAEQWHGQEQSQWPERSHGEAFAHSDTWNKESATCNAEWCSNAYGSTSCDTASTAWNAAPPAWNTESATCNAEWCSNAYGSTSCDRANTAWNAVPPAWNAESGTCNAECCPNEYSGTSCNTASTVWDAAPPAWNAESGTCNAEWCSNAYAGTSCDTANTAWNAAHSGYDSTSTYCDTANTAWNVAPPGYGSTPKLVEGNNYTHGLRAPWRYGSA